MLKPFQKNLSDLVPEAKHKSFLLAVSSGVDSMVMAELFLVSGFKLAIAHCNFGLRGKESDGDESFVKEWARKHKVHFHTKRFDTKKYAARHKLSIQMAARELRYQWLNQLRENLEFDHIAIAHNSDDIIETFFINLLRGTGIAGLHGIAGSNQYIIRPLLGFSRKEIESYAKEMNIKWREDSSNATDKYERNKIRHHLIPLLDGINPNSRKGIHNTIENLQAVEEVYNQSIQKQLKTICSNKNGKTYLSIAALKKSEFPAIYIYEAIKGFGFNYAQAVEVADAMDKQSGKVFLANEHRITKDRSSFIIEVLPNAKPKEFMVKPETKILSIDNFDIDFSADAMPKGFKPPVAATTACLDFSRLKFPLSIRKWQKGDKFYPLGMKKPKKVSDFLIDTKVSLSEKEDVFVLLSGNEIAWLIGRRIDERFKISNTTKKLYICNITLAHWL
jgi:tRNA(Ile)-lysidine synthase